MSSEKKIIALVGLMGAGKTTIGSKIAEKLDYYFTDLDQEIEDRIRKSISEIFAEDGEEYFRQIEKEIVKEIIARDETLVLSLGGGAFINEEIRNLLKKKAVTIWLDVSIDEIINRIGSKNNRPLLKSPNKREVLTKLHQERLPIYQKADHHIIVGQDNSDTIADQIIAMIQEND